MVGIGKKNGVFFDITLKKLTSDDDPFTEKSRRHVESFEFNLDPKKAGTKGKGVR